MNFTAKLFIDLLNLKKHSEGGYFAETYRSGEVFKSENLPPGYSGERSFSTCIYFLLEGDDFSAFHKLKSDEIWHFYSGTNIRLYTIDEKGNYSHYTLGNDFDFGFDVDYGSQFQIAVKSGQWLAASLVDQKSYALVGCTVSPGFEYEDFELGKRSELIRLFPEHTEIIEKLTRIS